MLATVLEAVQAAGDRVGRARSATRSSISPGALERCWRHRPRRGSGTLDAPDQLRAVDPWGEPGTPGPS